MLSRRVLLCAALLALACVSSANASGLDQDPYTLADGTVVDPTNPDSANRPRDNSADSIYMPLSHNGPMGGMGPRGSAPNHASAHGGGGLRRQRQLGIRSEQDDGYVV